MKLKSNININRFCLFMKIYVCHSCGYDYKKELYEPLRKSFLEIEFFFPHEGDNSDLNTLNVIKDCDLVIGEVSFNSLGVGIELGRAQAYKKKVLLIYKKGQEYNKALRFISSNLKEYEDEKDMIRVVSEFLKTTLKL